MLRSAMTVLSAVVLCSCSAVLPPPRITYDHAAFRPATRRRAPAVPAPVPSPPAARGGAVFNLPPAKARMHQPPLPLIAAANARALMRPRAQFYRQAAQIYPYSPDALYRLYATPGEVCDIALQPGEKVSAISAGDTVRWAIGTSTSGTGAALQVHVLIKPFYVGLKTDLVILTDRRTYHLLLASTEHTAMLALAWRYPSDLVGGHTAQLASATAAADNPAFAPDALHFRYRISGATAPWRPLRAFDDGHKVYIEFPARLDQGDAPPLFVVGAKGGAELVNYRVRGRFYVVDRLFAAAELRLGRNPQQIVRISRSDGTAPVLSDSWF